MIALCGGPDVRCADYATFGTQELADNAVTALDGRKAVLLANHGVIALGATLEGARTIAAEVENLATQYLALLAAGLKPVAARRGRDEARGREIRGLREGGVAPSSTSSSRGAKPEGLSLEGRTPARAAPNRSACFEARSARTSA